MQKHNLKFVDGGKIFFQLNLALQLWFNLLLLLWLAGSSYIHESAAKGLMKC